MVEYLDRQRCPLRELDLTGQVRKPARAVACDTRPVGETWAGLWLRYGPDSFAEQTRSFPDYAYHVELVDPATLTPTFRAAQVSLVDERTDLVFPHPTSRQMQLCDTATGRM